MTHTYTIDSVLGPLTLEATDEAVIGLLWGGSPGSTAPTPLLAKAGAIAKALAAGEDCAVNVPVAPHGTPFQRKIWSLIAAIPHGKTRSYADLAHEAGSAPRAVGQACARNPLPLLIPCHRVLGAGGKLGGYSGVGGLATKERLLGQEQAAA